MYSNALKALVFLGSVRDGRMAERVGKFVAEKLKDAKFHVEILDPEELNLPLLKQPLQFYPDPKQAPKIVQDLNEKIKSADCFVIISAEYNRQMPPALTNLIDHFPPRSYSFKSSAIVTYSLGAGGQMAAAQVRTLMVEMGAPPVPYLFHIPEVSKKLDEKGVASSEEYVHKQAEKMITQLTWYATALKNHRSSTGEPEWGATVSV